MIIVILISVILIFASGAYLYRNRYPDPAIALIGITQK